MQKNIYSSRLINYHCTSCQAEYQSYSTAKENKKVDTCANCSPVYKGETVVKLKIKRAEKLLQRQQKEQEKAEKKKASQQKAQERSK
jgi:ribosomal protein L31